MSVSAELNEASADEGEDALRALVSSMLSGRHKDEVYLREVSSRCLEEPDSAPALLGIIDRYYRLGRMPAAQYQKVKAKIEEAMGTRPPSDAPESKPLAEDDEAAGESATRELAALRPESATRTGRGRARASPSEPVNASATERLDGAAGTTAPPPASSPPRFAAGPTPRAAVAPPLAAARAKPAPPAVAAASDARALTIGIGTVLRDRYELLQLLGRGGMASVYKARDRYRTSLGVADCNVAIKIVQPHPSRPGSVDALGREFHNAQRLSHPNAVNVYDIDHEGDASFYSMEMLEGERLSHLIRQAGFQFPRRYAFAIIRDIGAAVAHAHSRGVVHADLKPHNIMITTDGHVRVLDFGSGIVRPGEPWISELSPGGDYRQATPAYASCEQLQGWCADPRDDIYALACLAYQLFAGKHPFDQRSSLVARGKRMRPRRPPAMRGDSWRALRRGLAWSREQRDMTMEKWLEQLGVADAAESLPPLARLRAAPPPRLWPRRAAAATLVLFSLGLAAIAFQRQAGVDWQQVVAGARSSWERIWQQLPSFGSAGESTASAPPSAVSPFTPPPLAAVTAPHNTGKPAAPPASRVRPARAASIAGAPPLAAMAAMDEVPTAASDDAGSPRAEFAATSYEVAGGAPAARIVVRRLGRTDADVSFIWWTEGASAQPEVDYASLGRRIETIPSGADRITVYVPIISNPQRSHLSQFYVALGDPNAARSTTTSARATVTIDRGD
jgi:serine/threonine protein kinase